MNESMATKLYILRSGQTIEFLGDPAAECLIGNQTLAERQIAAAAAHGFRVEVVGATEGLAPPYFVASEETFFTNRYFTAFVERARELGQNCRAGLASHPLVDRIMNAHPLAEAVEGGWLFELFYVVDPESEEWNAVLIAPDDLEHSTMALPAALRAERKETYFESSLAILQLESPLHLYQANMHANFERARQLLDAQGARWPSKAGAALDARGNLVGEGAFIHPSAWVEGSTIGKGAFIGPLCTVRYSIIGEGALIGDQSAVLRSVMGANAQIHMQCRLVHAVMYPDSYVSTGPLQFSFLGNSAALFCVVPTDARMDGKTIKTIVGGAVVDSGMPFLGLFVGHRAKLAAGLITGPGRIVPNDAELHPHPSRVYREFPADHDPREKYFI